MSSPYGKKQYIYIFLFGISLLQIISFILLHITHMRNVHNGRYHYVYCVIVVLGRIPWGSVCVCVCVFVGGGGVGGDGGVLVILPAT